MVRTSRRPWASVSKEAASPADGRAAPRTPEPARPGDLPRVPGMRRLNRIPPSLTPVKLVFQVQWEANPAEIPRQNTGQFSRKVSTSPSFCPFLTDRGGGVPTTVGGHWP